MGIDLACGLGLGQPGLLDPPAIALVPRQRAHSLEPVRCHCGQRVERGAEGFRDEFEPVEDADRREDVCRVGALLAPGCQQPQRLATLQQLLEEQLFGTAHEQAVPEGTQHGKVETRVRQLETQQILPVDARADRLGRLAIRQVFPKLHDGHQRQPPWGQARLSPRREQGGKVFILKDRPKCISEGQIRMPFGKGRMGHTSGFCRHRLDDVRVERHERRPSAE
jgi:hypothetical protein